MTIMRRRIYGIRIIVMGLFFVATIGSSVNVSAQYNEDTYSGQDIIWYDPRTPACSSEGASVTQLSGKDNREKMWNYLKLKGLSAEQAAGVLGNIQTESGGSFSPTVNEFGKAFGVGGYGIVQWTAGRRAGPSGVVPYLKKLYPDVMAQYYADSDLTKDTDEYGKSSSTTGIEAGFIPKSFKTGIALPTEVNDKLLLGELDFLYAESTTRTLHNPAVSRGYGSPRDNEWETIKKQTTIEGASNVWVYSFEIPDKIDETAASRVSNGQKIYDIYKDQTGAAGSSCSLSGSAPSSDKKALAKSIIANPNIFYETQDNNIKGSRQIFQDIAAGSNNGNDFPCGVNIKIMQILDAIGKDHKIRVNSLNRGCASSNANGASSSVSRHSNGNGSAVDFGRIDNNPSYESTGAIGIVTIINPFQVPGSGVGQNKCPGLANLPVANGVSRFPDSCTHLHVDFPPNADPGLKCKLPLDRGGCDASQQV